MPAVLGKLATRGKTSPRSEARLVRHDGVLVKRLPGWQIDKTCLDLMHEGKPGEVPQQVTSAAAFHPATARQADTRDRSLLRGAGAS